MLPCLACEAPQPASSLAHQSPVKRKDMDRGVGLHPPTATADDHITTTDGPSSKKVSTKAGR